jgi:hypothetical protein
MITIEKAILEINPNASMIVRYDDNNDFEIEWTNNTAPISKEDILAKQSELQTAEDAKVQAKINAQVSGNQKLLDLGLTQAEATALTGYTPPTEV